MNIFKQFFKSLYSPKDIAMFRFQGIGKTILYVFFLTFVSVLPTIYYFSNATLSGVEKTSIALEEKLPPFSIENSQLVSNKNTPIIIEEDEFTIFFDSSGAVNKDDLEDTNNTFALLKNEVVLVAGERTQSYPYSMLSDAKISKKQVLNFLQDMDKMMVIILPVFFVIIFLFSSAVKFIEITFLALLGLVLKNISGRNLPYRQSWRMAAYSVTLSTVFFTIMAAIKTIVPNGVLLSWFVGMIVLYLAINELPKPKKNNVL